MRIDQLDVVLRPRSQWEAMELGTALVRRHAGAIWKPWWLLTLPVFALLNLLGVWLDSAWLPAVALWWLKPVFEHLDQQVTYNDIRIVLACWRAKQAQGGEA